MSYPRCRSITVRVPLVYYEAVRRCGAGKSIHPSVQAILCNKLGIEADKRQDGTVPTYHSSLDYEHPVRFRWLLRKYQAVGGSIVRPLNFEPWITDQFARGSRDEQARAVFYFNPEVAQAIQTILDYWGASWSELACEAFEDRALCAAVYNHKQAYWSKIWGDYSADPVMANVFADAQRVLAGVAIPNPWLNPPDLTPNRKKEVCTT